MRKILLLLGLGLVALTGCKKDSSSLEESLIANLVMPEGPFAPGASVTIQGKGFTVADEIWFRTPTKADGDIPAEVTNRADNELTFTVPQVSAGEHAVVLKRGAQEMTLGKLTVSEAATKLYAFGGMEDLDDFEILWEVDKTTGELTEIVKLPTEISESVEALWEDYPVVNPADGNVYLCKRIGTENSGQWSDQLDLYCVNPNDKTLNKIGSLDKEAEDTRYYLCIVDGQLHALIEKDEDEDRYNQESFCSLVSIDTETAEQTPVADFGSLYQTLDIPGDVPAGIDGTAIYDKTTNSLIVPIYKDEETDAWQLARFDIANKKIIPGEKFNDYDWISIFPKDGTICGAFQTNEANSVDFRPIDTKNLTAGNSIGSATLETDSSEGPWCYDASTGKAFWNIGADFETDNEHYVLGAFDFNTQKLEEIKAYAPGIWLYELFQ